MEPAQTVRLSKTLSYILRHGAVKEKLNMRSDGYVALNELLARPKLKGVTQEQVEHVVKTNDKQRFHLKCEDDQWWIRANQGHSLKVKDMDLELLTDPLETCIHGTKLVHWNAIKNEGLHKMGRNHIHFSIGLPADASVISGMRSNSEVFIYIDMAKAMADGIKFYRSSNKVILTEGVDGTLQPTYFARVIDCHGQSLLE
ncbi:phosphotransferase KptA/Tpt1 [Radiomyces spectabilis]|uniref:phosphotransferase KptA/Tpt1 n=1 Tax=Radiomyces spectabilis TaxID=64574 RepID=UPI00221FB6D5|nr:phosphotransferase KptA/Tpt1 [Radiomyces spectabilis]KAI8388065.1 phosphotransferase KptA/Tpt1 [Radiomyces spectabilis]